jgi:hypothetical protein
MFACSLAVRSHYALLPIAKTSNGATIIVNTAEHTRTSTYVVQAYRVRDETEDWQYFVQCILEFLRPPHILELLILSTWSSNHTWKVDRPTYLRRLGFCDTRDGIVEHGDQVCFEEAVFPVSIWGKDVENELRRLVETEETMAARVSQTWF